MSRQVYTSIDKAAKDFPIGVKAYHKDNKSIGLVIEYNESYRTWTSASESAKSVQDGAYISDKAIFILLRLEDGTYTGTPPHMLVRLDQHKEKFYTILENGSWGFIELEGVTNEDNSS